jgi:cell wall-associated NlpC family hydrolase
MPRRRSTLHLALAVIASTAIATAAAPVGAAPIDDKQKLAASIEAEINANAEQLSALNERLKANQEQLDVATSTIADAERRISAAKAETRRLEALVRLRAAAAYRGSSRGGTDANLFDIDIRELSTREQYASAATARDDAVINDLAAARADLAAQRQDAKEAEASARVEQAQLDETRAAFEAAQAERERLLAQVQGEIKALVDAAAAARSAKDSAGIDPGNLPAASGSAGTAVAYAQAQLGKPYCYAGAGPDCFDCSGLTMKAWGAAGVGMSHNSEAQYASFPHVPMDQLQPGDIVWKPGHVGLYVGNGTVIHAPHTGDVVKYHGVSYYQSASRPG